MVRSLSPEIGEAEKREALERVLASGGFHRTGQLKSLLRYICEREIAGKGEGIDECTVAVEALGRPADYSPFEDGTVRNRVHNLRRRLEQYYDLDNPADPVLIEIPKGSYCPVFSHRAAPPPPIVELAVPLPPVPAFWDRRVTLRAVCVVAAIAVAIALAAYQGLSKERPSPDPVMAKAWGPLLAKNANPLLCISTAAQLTLIQRPMDPPFGRAAAPPDLQAWYRSLPGLPPSRQIFLGPSLTSPFWGDVAGALAINQVLSGAGVNSDLLPESAIQLPALNKRNLFMFGRPGFSKAVDLYLADKPFRVRIPDDEHTTVIWNVQPKPGEPAEYDARVASDREHRETAFGLITVMPSPGNANLKTVVFSGTLSPGTQAASEYFSSPKHLQALLQRFQKAGYAEFPAAYQVIVRATVFNTSALDVQYVAHRIIAEGPRSGRLPDALDAVDPAA